MGQYLNEKLVWVVEDSEKIASLLIDYLKAKNFRTKWFDTGKGVVDAVSQSPPDLILLDVMLPVVDGMTICKEIRAFSDVPIIFLTAKVEEIDRLLGLELGADDYICKPFSPREVIARVTAVLRRTERQGDGGGKGPFEVLESQHQIAVNGKALPLTPNEYNLMKTFLKHPGRVYSRDQLLDHLYTDFRAVTDRTIDTHIKNLRKKIEARLPGQSLIRAIYGVGYKLEI